MFKNIFVSVLSLTLGLSAFAKAKESKRNAASVSQKIIYYNRATVKIKEGEVERYLNAAREAKIFKLTRKEDGSISYLAYQSVDNPNLIIFNELWKSKEALDQHLVTSHMTRFFSAINFNPTLYDIKSNNSKVTFTPKADFTDYVIAELVLDGLAAYPIQ